MELRVDARPVRIREPELVPLLERSPLELAF
jgi:hypothetical protein